MGHPATGRSEPTRRPAREVEAWCAAFRVRCRDRGIRVTPQRLAVYRALAEDTAHPGAEGIHSRLREGMPTLSLATVYRILESFEREGLIRRVSTPGAAGRFDANVGAHQHLVCRACDRVTDFVAPGLARVGIPAAIPPDFHPEGLDIRIVGLCLRCRESGAAGAMH